VTDTELALTIANDAPADGPPATPDGGGMGMVGMRERVNLYEGTLKAGPTPGGGYLVEARIPLQLEGR
jgi:signal transduction histidine kinase